MCCSRIARSVVARDDIVLRRVLTVKAIVDSGVGGEVALRAVPDDGVNNHRGGE